MDVQHLFETMILQAGVRTVYGDPVSAQGKTIIPVAQVAYGFGGGAGRRRERARHAADEAATPEPERAQQLGGGGGGGFRGVPVGVFEIGDQGTRFVSIRNRQRMALALLAGLAIGYAAARLSK